MHFNAPVIPDIDPSIREVVGIHRDILLLEVSSFARPFTPAPQWTGRPGLFTTIIA
jgi:hypothetical protein